MSENLNTLLATLTVVFFLFLLMIPLSNRLMRKRTYILDPDGKNKLEVRTNRSWRRCHLYFNESLIGKVNSKGELLRGCEFPLPDGSVVKIQLQKIFLSYSELQVWHAGQALQDFTPFSGDALNLNKGTAAVFVIGLFPFIWLITLVVLRLLINHSLSFTLPELEIIFQYVAWGAFYLVLSFFTYRKSLLSILIAVSIYLLDGVFGVLIFLSMIGIGQAEVQPGLLELMKFAFLLPWGIAFVVIHLFLLVLMFQGLGAIVSLRSKNSLGRLNPLPLIVLMLCAGLATAGFFAVRSKPELLTGLQGFYSKVSLPISDLSTVRQRRPLAPTSELEGDQTTGGTLCWTSEITGFSGNRSQAWESLLNTEIQFLIPFSQFKEGVVTYNPQLASDGYIFDSQKTYLLPEPCK